MPNIASPGCCRRIVLAVLTLAAAGCGAAERAELAKIRAELEAVRSGEAKTGTGRLDKAKEDAAKLQIDVLTKACQAFEVENGERPASLQALVQLQGGNAPKLDDPRKIIDPWGKQYQYDPVGAKNGDAKPDIWTVTPDGRQIGNWPGMK